MPWSAEAVKKSGACCWVPCASMMMRLPVEVSAVVRESGEGVAQWARRGARTRQKANASVVECKFAK
jgi:hypothetical protein